MAGCPKPGFATGIPPTILNPSFGWSCFRMVGGFTLSFQIRYQGDCGPPHRRSGKPPGEHVRTIKTVRAVTRNLAADKISSAAAY